MEYVFEPQKTWCITGITDAMQFFLALKWLMLPDIRLHLEIAGFSAEHVRGYLARKQMPRQPGLIIGSKSPPADRVYQMKLSEDLLTDLAGFSSSGDLTVDHVGLFTDTDILVEYTDAFMTESVVCISKLVPLNMVRGFSEQLGVDYLDGADVFADCD